MSYLFLIGCVNGGNLKKKNNKWNQKSTFMFFVYLHINTKLEVVETDRVFLVIL